MVIPAVSTNKVVLADTFLDSLNRLDKQSRKVTLESLARFHMSERGNGFQLHNLDRIDCDTSFRTARVNKELRLVISQQSGNHYIILYVDHHDEAYQWAAGKYMAKSAFGALYVYDSKMVAIQTEFVETNAVYDAYNDEPSLLAQREITAKDLTKLGIPELHAKLLFEIKDEESYLSFISVFPQELQEALFDLASGTKNLTEVYAELQDQAQVGDELSNAIYQKDSKRRFYLVSDLDELERLSELETDKWKLFLHPKQEFLVRQNFRGPVLVEGGPGTGKTVVGIHRAVHLAENVYPSNWEKNILFCTFSSKLAAYIQDKITQLLVQKGLEQTIQVRGVDSLLFTLVSYYKLSDMQPDIEKYNELFRETYEDLAPQRSYSFLRAEYEEVIRKKRIRTLDDYLRVRRQGQGEGLSAAARRSIWPFFDALLQRQQDQRLIDFDDLAEMIVYAVRGGRIQPMFDSIIIDEAQDLSPIKFKALGALCRQRHNNMFILSDQNQRIFKLTSWRNDVNVEIVGRTYYLNLNYRTTKQIREYADQQFIFTEPDRLHIREYKSLLLGSEPTVRAFQSQEDQYRYIAHTIRELLAEGYQAHEIGIITNGNFHSLEHHLKQEGNEYTILRKNIYPRQGYGVSISTLQGCKGLEFSIVFLSDYTMIGKGLDIEGLDEYYRELRKKQLECLRYVATTRARERLYVTYVR